MLLHLPCVPVTFSAPTTCCFIFPSSIFPSSVNRVPVQSSNIYFSSHVINVLPFPFPIFKSMLVLSVSGYSYCICVYFKCSMFRQILDIKITNLRAYRANQRALPLVAHQQSSIIAAATNRSPLKPVECGFRGLYGLRCRSICRCSDTVPPIVPVATLP